MSRGLPDNKENREQATDVVGPACAQIIIQYVEMALTYVVGGLVGINHLLNSKEVLLCSKPRGCKGEPVIRLPVSLDKDGS